MKSRVCVMITALLLGSVSSASADQMIDDFDNVVIGDQWGGGEWGEYPASLFRQSTGDDPVYAGTGSGVVYHDDQSWDPWGTDSYLSKTLAAPLDLSAEAAGPNPRVSIMMHVSTAEDNAAISFLKLSSQYYHSEFIWTEQGGGVFGSGGQTYDVGWNEIIIPLGDFIESSTTSITPDWGNITRIEIGTSSGYPNVVMPTDVVFDNLMISGVPEPSSIALLGMGGLGLFLRRRR